MRNYRLALVVLVAVLCGLAAGCADSAQPGAVHVLEATGSVDLVFERYVERGIERAERERAAAVVLRVDTPGGRGDSMRHVVGLIQSARVPVITYVSPQGAQAASAGTFIVMAGHVAAMAPSTTIGAATPITVTGDDIEGALGRKVENDAAAFARGVAEAHGRNSAWAEQAVREAVSASAPEAQTLGVVDLVANDLPALLSAVEGRTVRVDGADVRLGLARAPLAHNGQNLYERALRFLSEPLVVGLLLLFGIAGVLFEFHAPGLFAPGAIGVLAIIAALVGVGTLLPEEAAAVLIGLGIVLLLLELVLPGGVVGSLGALALLLGLATLLARQSTELDGGLLLTAGAFVLVVLGLLTGVAFLLVARNYIAPKEPPGTARL